MPYRTSGRGLDRQQDADSFDVAEVIRKEFTHAISRQSKPGQSDVVRESLDPKVTGFLENAAKDWDHSKPLRRHSTDSKCQHLLKP